MENSDDSIDPANLELQIAEYDMLASMFPSEDELILDNPAVICEVSEWMEKVQSKISLELPPCISFTLRLRFETVDQTLEICCRLPQNYPGSKPLEIHARSEGLTRLKQAELNSALSDKVKSDFVPGDLMCGALIAWLQETGASYFKEVKVSTNRGRKKTLKKEQFVRLWIVSHHIYSNTKRKTILELSKELTGFCMPGRPGIICLEGKAEDCNEVWTAIKSMTWKKIGLKLHETWDPSKMPYELWQRFSKFEEIGFVKGSDFSREYHMDMGAFGEYMKNHNCQNIFKELFKIE